MHFKYVSSEAYSSLVFVHARMVWELRSLQKANTKALQTCSSENLLCIWANINEKCSTTTHFALQWQIWTSLSTRANSIFLVDIPLQSLQSPWQLWFPCLYFYCCQNILRITFAMMCQFLWRQIAVLSQGQIKPLCGVVTIFFPISSSLV